MPRHPLLIVQPVQQVRIFGWPCQAGCPSSGMREALFYVIGWHRDAKAGDPRHSGGSERLDLVTAVHEWHGVEACGL
jgi:hypothetical protein